MLHRYLLSLALALFVVIPNNIAFAQRSSKKLQPKTYYGTQPKDVANDKTKTRDGKTRVSVEILTGSEGLGLGAQSLRSLFDNLGYTVHIRQGTSQDKVETRQKELGKSRLVTVVGRLEKGSRLVFADRAFSTNDTDKLKEWLRELETYGSQGAPEGKPLWGMTDDQFKEVHRALAPKVRNDIQGETFEAAVSQLELPSQYPLRISTEASSWLRSTFPKIPPVRQRLKDCTKGTALAIVTNEYGLGYRPLRTPEGQIELVVDPLTKTTDVWPIGWKLERPEPQVVPGLYRLDPVEFNKTKLVDALDSIATESGVPVRFDYFGIKTQGIELEKLLANQRRQKVPLSRVLSRITNPNRLDSHIRIDEAGQPFIWITFLVPEKPVQ